MNTRQASRPCMIPWAQAAPGSISRGAIQHLIPADSRWAQIASAVGRSLLEWLMKTIDGKLLGARILLDLLSNGLQKNRLASVACERHRFLGPTRNRV